jgi:hypothetical protein
MMTDGEPEEEDFPEIPLEDLLEDLKIDDKDDDEEMI